MSDYISDDDLKVLKGWNGQDVRDILPIVEEFVSNMDDDAGPESLRLDDLVEAINGSEGSKDWPVDLSDAFEFIALDKSRRYISISRPVSQRSDVTWDVFEDDEAEDDEAEGDDYEDGDSSRT